MCEAPLINPSRFFRSLTKTSSIFLLGNVNPFQAAVFFQFCVPKDLVFYTMILFSKHEVPRQNICY